MYLVRIPGIFRLFFPKALWRVKTKEKRVYLTFDDGPIPEVTPWLLDLLEHEGVKATFFCVGDNVFKYPDIYNRMVRDGHRVGNHTFNHIRAFHSQKFDYINNVSKAEEYIKSDLFRPPHGQMKLAFSRTLRRKFKIVFWDLLSCDFDQDKTGEDCFQIVKKYTRPGSIIVFHDSIKAELNLRYSLPKSIRYLKQQGYQFGVI